MNFYIDAQKIISERKFNAEKLARENYTNLLKNDKFLEIEEEINCIIPQIAFSKFQKNPGKTKSLNEELVKLEKKKKAFLKTLKMTTKDIEPNYNCKICNDYGYINDVACSCLNQIVIKLITENSGLPSRNLNTFKDFKENIYRDSEKENAIKLKEKMQVFASKYPDVKNPNILFIGQSGTGKTFMIDCIVTEIISRGINVMYTTAFSLNNLMLKYHTTFDETKNYYLDNILSCDLLVIDDLGIEPILKNVTQEYLYSIINERKIMNKGTIISTNLSINESLNRYGERTTSRIFDKNSTLVINIKNHNLRSKK